MNHSISTSLRATVSRLVAVLTIVLLLQQSVVAQLPQQPASSGSPAQIRSATRIFLTNAGAQTGFPYDSSVAYEQFADHLRAWADTRWLTNPRMRI